MDVALHWTLVGRQVGARSYLKQIRLLITHLCDSVEIL